MKTPKGKPTPLQTRIANGRKSKVRAVVEHVVAQQKGPLGLRVRTVGIAHAGTRISLAKTEPVRASSFAQVAAIISYCPSSVDEQEILPLFGKNFLRKWR